MSSKGKSRKSKAAKKSEGIGSIPRITAGNASAFKTKLSSLLDEIDEGGDEVLDKLDEEQVRNLRKTLNAYSHITGLQDKWAVFSITNLERRYQEYLTMTGMAAFLYQMLDEFDPDDHPQLDGIMIDMEEHFPEKFKQYEGFKEFQFGFKEFFQKYFVEHFREYCHGFLGTLFKYDPADHVRTAKNKKVKSLNIPIEEVAETIPVPPADSFARYRRYYENHYEYLRAITTKRYGLLPVFEDALQIMGVFNSDEKANAFMEKYKDDFTTQVRKAQLGGWVFTGPFEQNREKMTYLNENTELLADIIKRTEQDEKDGAALMAKRTRKKKKREYERVGPDAAGLDEYERTMGKKLAKKRVRRPVNEGSESGSGSESEESDGVELMIHNITDGGKNMSSKKVYLEHETEQELEKRSNMLNKALKKRIKEGGNKGAVNRIAGGRRVPAKRRRRGGMRIASRK